MELIINHPVKEIKPSKLYEISIKFMEGDADGWKFHTIRFEEDKLKDPGFKKELERFYKHIKACIQADSGGRGGFDTEYELIKEYRNVQDWFRYVSFDVENFFEEDAIDETDADEEKEFIEEYGISFKELAEVPISRQLFVYEVPCDRDGYYTSYRNIEINYYDSNGDKCSVTVQD
jgi:hypothetical protein